MAEVVGLDRVLQVVPEVTNGTLLPATKQLQSIMLMPNIMATGTPFVAEGSKYANVMSIDREWTEADLTIQPTYDEIIYPLSGLFGAATIATPGGGVLSRTWTWNLSGTALDALKTFSVETGDSTQAENFAFGLMTALNLKFARDKVSGTGKMIGQKTTEGATLTALSANNAVQTLTITGTPTGGTFTLTFQGVTSGTIAYNAAASAVQTALVAMSNIGAGNVVVAGSAMPGGSQTITFQGNLGNQTVGTITTTSAGLTGGSTPTAVITNTTPGVSITPQPYVQPIVPNQINVYMDPSSGSLGTTQELRDFDIEWSVADKYTPVWVLNSSSGSFATAVEKEPKTYVRGTLASDAQGRTFLTSIRANTRQFMRILCTGPIIEGALAYSLTMDIALNVQAVGKVKEFEGLYVRDYTSQIMHDYGWGYAMKIVVQNRQVAL